MTTSSFAWALTSLDNESQILSRLLYRNNNQHGKTKVFAHLKGIKKELGVFTVERMRKLSDMLERSIRLASSSQKISQIDFEDVIANLNITSKALHRSTIAASWCVKTSECLIKLLEMKVFVPLFTLLLALVARIATCLSIIVPHFEVRFQTLCGQVKNIGLLQPRFADRTNACLSSVILTNECVHVIQAMRTMATGASTSSNPSSTGSSSSGSSGSRTTEFTTVVSQMDSLGEDTGDVIIDNMQQPVRMSTAELDESINTVAKDAELPAVNVTSGQKRKRTEVQQVSSSADSGKTSKQPLPKEGESSVLFSADLFSQPTDTVIGTASGESVAAAARTISSDPSRTPAAANTVTTTKWVNIKKNKTKNKERKKLLAQQQQKDQQLLTAGNHGDGDGPTRDEIDDIFGDIV